MRNLIISIGLIILVGCSRFEAYFQPPINTDYWTHDKLIKTSEFFDIRKKDMRECGIDPFDRYHIYIKQGLCMEAKGWRWTGGPVCEDTVYSTTEELKGPLCRAWRQEHGK